ncbi:hypothetical protein F4778DRAFT_744593 [Xylariomycetidae sp. FL2044]|nr:hypothetical protein F4778DRAFT_744593 [Xylariomycetidae sp. FL2044]
MLWLFLHWPLPFDDHELWGPTLSRRINPDDPLWYTGEQCGDNPPDPDLGGLGARIGLYMQTISLSLAIATGNERLLTAIPACIVTGLTFNIVLTLKATQVISSDKPVIQDFWLCQGQLFLMTSIIPFAMLFGQWKRLGVVRERLAAALLVYTYVQALWFWLSGYAHSDEVVCIMWESSLGPWGLFTQGGRWVMVGMYFFGLLVLLPLAMASYVRGRPGVFAGVLRSVKTRWLWVKATVLSLLSVPLYAFCMWTVENTARRGYDKQWTASSGQWLALGVGVATLTEALWATCKCVWREIYGDGVFADNFSILGGTI